MKVGKGFFKSNHVEYCKMHLSVISLDIIILLKLVQIFRQKANVSTVLCISVLWVVFSVLSSFNIAVGLMCEKSVSKTDKVWKQAEKTGHTLATTEVI